MKKLFLLLLLGCATSPEIYLRHQLAQQILKPRVGHNGLTNRVCLEYEGPLCKKPEIQEYSFSDENFRTSVNAMGFICKVASRRFKICLDKPGLCRITYKHSGFLGLGRTKLEEYIPSSNYQFLIDANTKCFQKNEYDFDSI